MATCCISDVNKILGNTGTSNKMPAPGIAKRVFRIPLYTNAGVRNGIDMTQLGNSVYVNGLLNNTDPSARLSPLPKSVSFVREQADSLSETYADQSIANIVDGVLSVVNTIAGLNASPAMAREIETDECALYGEYIVDICGGFTGGSVVGDILYPLEVNSDSLVVKYLPNDYAAKQKIELSYQYDTLLKGNQLYTVDAASIAVNLLTVSGLHALDVTLSAVTITEGVADVTTIFGYSNNKEVVTGLLAADFVATNTTTSTAITIDLATEGPDGTYQLDWNAGSAPVVGNDVEVYVSKATLSPDDRGSATTV